MTDWAAAGVFVAILGIVSELAYRENLRIRKRAEEVIEDIYPSLMDNIEESIHNYEVHYNNPSTSYTNFLNLRTLRKNHKIIKIREINKKTYEYLIEVENEIIPRLDESDKMKKTLYDKIVNEWINYLESLPNIHYNHRAIAVELYNQTRLSFLEDGTGIIKLEFTKLMKNLIQNDPNTNIPFYPSETIDALTRIAKNNIKELKELDKQIRQLFTSIIKEKLLPEMDKDIQNTVK